jgi:hypothetical protein
MASMNKIRSIDEQSASDTRRSKDVRESIAGPEVSGYRAAAFSTIRDARLHNVRTNEAAATMRAACALLNTRPKHLNAEFIQPVSGPRSAIFWAMMSTPLVATICRRRTLLL